jgi:hypothetical protein
LNEDDMRTITIVGGGHAGLQLGIALRQRSYDVTIVANKTGDEIRDGSVTSSQCMFDDAQQAERDLGLNFWEAACPDVDGIGLIVPSPAGGKALDWAYRLRKPAQSVDQRVKIPGWMAEFERIGGRLLIHEAGIDDLERYAQASDLVIVAAGKGSIAGLFERDADRSPYDKPQRALALTYVHGMVPHNEFSRVSFNLCPGIGEYFVFPALTTSGPCEIMVFEGVPGGAMDCWSDVTTPQTHLARSREILDRFFPWEAARCERIELTDANGVLRGRFPPTVRRPVAELPSGALVFGMADVVVLNDPLTGQGANNASKSARAYFGAILQRGDRAFDRSWMQATFDAYWEYAQYVVGWTNALLRPPPPHVLNILGAAQTNAVVGQRFVDGFDHPPSLFPWLAEPAEAERFLAEAA